MARPCIVLVALALLSGCGPSPPEFAESIAPILAGDPDDADPGVVGLLANGSVYCTGTLISSRVVVTAAHCLGDGTPTEVFFGASTTAGGKTRSVARAQAHPLFTVAVREQDAVNDIAALLLDADAPPDAFSANMPDERSTSRLVAGAPIRIVGFGGTSPTQALVGIKRVGFTTIDTVQSATFVHHADPSRTCAGDSGGPAFLTVNGREYFVGVAAGGDPDCADYGVHTRVDAHIPDFLAHFPEPTADLGTRCYRDDNCISGLCVKPNDASAFAYCSSPCRTDSDCDATTACTRDGSGARLCRPGSGEPGGLGTVCTAASDCGSGSCGRAGNSRDATCTIDCSTADDVACPGEYVCAPDAARDGQSGCFRRPDAGGKKSAVPEVAGQRPSPGGCDVRRPPRERRRPRHEPLVTIAALLLLRVLRRTERRA